MDEHHEELPTQRVAGVEYLSCQYCGEPVSQLGTRKPRTYCKRSHRQRAYEARRRKAEIKEAVEKAKREAETAARTRSPRAFPVLPKVDPAVLLRAKAELQPDPPAVRPAVVPVESAPAPLRVRLGSSPFPMLWDDATGE
ncbi:hypothetical protein [Streptomyces filamentosus]|uniref:hypothetical protein n=1 Tax=Streptomyces filamentosus TaxID=67294 RepID=UPI0037D44372